MMWCPITSPRERGGRGPGSSSSSLSSRRQWCPADRKCTEAQTRGSGVRGHASEREYAVEIKGEAGRTLDICFRMGLKTKTEERIKRTDQWTEESFFFTGRAHEFLQRPRLSFFVFLSLCLYYEHVIYEKTRWNASFLPNVLWALVFKYVCPRSTAIYLFFLFRLWHFLSGGLAAIQTAYDRWEPSPQMNVRDRRTLNDAKL